MNNTPATTETFAAAPRTGDFENVVNLLSVLGEANRKLTALQADIQAGYLDLVNAHRGVYGKLQQTVTETEAALEVIARRNPSWFADAKTVKTPYGSVKFTSSKELVVANEEVSIKLIEAFGRPELLRATTELNREALAELSDAELAQFALVRKPKENLTVKTDVVDLGKAVKSAEKSEAAATKTAKAAAKLTGREGFTLVEIFIVCAIIGLIAAMAIPAFQKARGLATEVPPSATPMRIIDGEARFALVRVTEFSDSFAYNHQRAAYILTDKKTGKDYVGVSGIGIVELGNHSDGDNHVEDER